jgi:DUF1680 family protein
MKALSRREFALALTTATAAPAVAQQVPNDTVAKGAVTKTPQNANAAPQNTSVSHKGPLSEEKPPFGETIVFGRSLIAPKVEAFPMTEVRVGPGQFKEAQDANLAFLKRLDSDRLLHNFRVNAGLPSSAKPLGGWEKPDCELRGHFVGHYLSACALMYSSTGDKTIKEKGEYIIAELAKCQDKLGGGYLSAFPLEFFDRLNRREKVWAPFYTIHKIMAGMYDSHEHFGNKQALQVLKGMADWADHLTSPVPEPHMQEILNTEYGGMNEVLYNLAAVTGDDRYALVGDRFTKKWFFNPLALRRDELRGLHVNTHIPQVIGAARRYEISGDERFHDVADFFWYEVTTARAYVTGGTSNGEAWLAEPRQLGAELKLNADTTECCCAYNMLKLTRHLYSWTADPRYFDYYERTLYNHRLGAINLETGHTQYYLSIVPAAWRTFGTEDDSFWCCNGTGIEEFSKLNNSIYFHDGRGIYVNLFIPSELQWQDKGVRLRQETKFPESPRTILIFEAAAPVQMALHIRIPHWVGTNASLSINGERSAIVPSPGSYITVARTWKHGDQVQLDLPMYFYAEAMPDEPTTKALLYGPLVLGGTLGSDDLDRQMIFGPLGPDVKRHPQTIPRFRSFNKDPDAWIKAIPGESLTFRTVGQDTDVTLIPFNRILEERYSIYWTVT